MASKRIDRGTIIILDVGRNVSTPEQKNEKSFFESARECTGRIIERKILSQDNNFLGIILLGTKKTNNTMATATPGAFRHIEVFSELTTPTWQLIRDLPEKATNSVGDWFDALIVAADHLKHGVRGVKFTNKKIVLMTNFKSPSDFDSSNAEMVINGFKEENFEVDTFGPDIYDKSNQNPDIELAQQLVHSTGGVSVTFDYCMKFLLFHQKKVVGCRPWNVDLSFTPEVKIPVSCYVKLKDEAVVKPWMKAVKDPVTKMSSSTEGITKNVVHVNLDNQTVVTESEIIKGYHYGQEIIPFSEYDKSMLYEAGEKSLKIYGFTNANNITWHHLNGDNLLYVFGRKGDIKAQHAITCLVECLQEQNLVGVVRRVFNNGNAPKMFALMPVVDSNNLVCLSMVGICYKEEIKNMAFPPTNLKKYQCTDDQVDAFKDLIKAMDLMKAYEDSETDDAEAFPIAETFSPTAQYILDSIAFRAMNPVLNEDQILDELARSEGDFSASDDDDLYEAPEVRRNSNYDGYNSSDSEDGLLNTGANSQSTRLSYSRTQEVKVPPPIEKRSKDTIEKLKKLFELRKVEVKRRHKKDSSITNGQDISALSSELPQQNNDVEMIDIPKIDMKSLERPKNISKIGTVQPIHDYKILQSQGYALDELSSQLAGVVESLIHTNIDGKYLKALECLTFFREECVKSQPSHYNNWLKVFKMELLDSKKYYVLDLLASKKLDYILKSENDLSNFENTEQGDSQLYENDTVPTLTDMTVSSEVKDMFDDI